LVKTDAKLRVERGFYESITKSKNGSSLRLTLATRLGRESSLDLGLVDSVYSNPRECTSNHQGPHRVPRQRIRVKAAIIRPHRLRPYLRTNNIISQTFMEFKQTV